MAWCLLVSLEATLFVRHIDKYYETILHDLSYIFRENRESGCEGGEESAMERMSLMAVRFSSGQTLCGIVLWRSAYQNGPAEGFWPVCSILPEQWGAPKGAVL